MEEPMEPNPDYDRVLSVMTTVEAPPALRDRIAQERDRTLIRRMIVKRMKLTGVLAGAAAVLGITVGLLSVSQKPEGPEPLVAAALASRPTAAAPPAVDPEHDELLKASVGGVTFPRWDERYRWTPTGQRTDELEGRATRTVFYTDPRGVRLGYTIVDGEPLAWPEGARRVTSGGVDVHLVRRGGRILAFWRAGGRTCILSAPDTVSEDVIVRLAASKAYA